MENKNETTLNNLLTNLNLVLDDVNLSKVIIKNNDFATIINRELIAAKYLANKDKKKQKEVEKVIKKYETVSSKKFDDKTNQFTNDADAIDYANYLVVYCRNILKVDLAVLKKNPKASAKVETPTVMNVEDRQPKNEQVNTGFFGGMEFDPNSPNITIPNPTFQKKAQENAQKRILNDEVSLYQSYPKHIIWFKWFFTGAMILYAAMLIGLAVVYFLINGAQTSYYPDSSSGTPYSFSTIFEGVFCILFSLLFFYMSYTTLIGSYIQHSIKHTKVSKNEKVGISTWNFILNAIFALIYAFFIMWPCGLGNVFTYHQWATNTDNTINLVACIDTLIVLTAICLGAVLIMGICAITLCATKPKPIEGVVQQVYMEELNKLMHPETAQDTPTDITNHEIKKPETKDPKDKPN